MSFFSCKSCETKSLHYTFAEEIHRQVQALFCDAAICRIHRYVSALKTKKILPRSR
jgi:hypothetical protein